MTGVVVDRGYTRFKGLSGAALIALVLEAGVLAVVVFQLSHAAVKEQGKPQPVMLSFPVLPTPQVQPSPPQPVTPPPPAPQPPKETAPPKPIPPKPVEPKPAPPKPVEHKVIPHKAIKPPPEKHRVEHPLPVVHHDAPPQPVAPPVPTPPPPAPVASPPPSVVTTGVTASFETKVRDAVQSALRFPAAARMMHLSGRTKVGFSYRDGQVSDAHVVTSSGSDVLDRAAIDAVYSARYPMPEDAQKHHVLTFDIWVVFTLHDDD
jgi:protein TonB